MHFGTNMKLHHVVASAAAALLVALPLVCSAQDKGWFGFEIKRNLHRGQWRFEQRSDRAQRIGKRREPMDAREQHDRRTRAACVERHDLFGRQIQFGRVAKGDEALKWHW